MIKENIKGITRISAILLFLSLTVSIAKAQAQKDDTALSNKLSADLSVSVQTARALKAALSSPEQQAKNIHANTQMSPKQKQQQMAALLAKRRRAIDSLLTPEQKKAFLQQAATARQASYRQTGNDTSRVNH
jgi:Spy/CpxP family protein refolding chaperone